MKKQVEEMAKIMCRSCYRRCDDTSGCIVEDYAEDIYNAGYRKKGEGEWVKVMNHKECSKCGYNAPYKKIKAGYHLQDLSNYCPNCGAKMKGAEDEKAD